MQFNTNRSNRVFVYFHSRWVGAMSVAHSFASCRISSILFTSFLLGAVPATAQNASNVERSPEAITLVQRVLDASGGDASIAAIHDLVATGTVSSPVNLSDTEEGSVTISLRGLDQMRIDSTLPTGTRSVFYNHGGLSSQETDGSVLPIGGEDEVSSISQFYPLVHFAAALHDSSYSLTVPETVTDEESGHNLYHLRLQRIRSVAVGSAHRSVSSVALDYYVDATSNCIVRVQHRYSDRGITPTNKGPFEIYQFDDYHVDHGIFMPHHITVTLDKRLISTTRISKYQLNTGLAESYFTPARKH